MNENFLNDGFFKIDPECHLIGDLEPVNHFPGVQMWWQAVENIIHPLMQGASESYYSILEPWEMQKSSDPENIIKAMDKYSVDIACLLPESMMDTTGYSSRWCTNGDTWKVVQKHPDRFIIEPNLSPIKYRGVENAIWEMEYWVEQGARIFKYYPPEDTYINDPDLWPFYKRAEKLGIVLDIHTGFSWVPPGKSKYCLPIQLDDVARDFPNLKLVAFHMGYPHCDDLNMVAMGHPNVYLCLSLLVPWAITAPYKFGKILGEAMRFAGPERIIWGTDSAGYAAQIGAAVVGLRNFQIPEELQWQYGYVPLTDDDKRRIFGGNLAMLLGIDPNIRRVSRNSSGEAATPITYSTSMGKTVSVAPISHPVPAAKTSSVAVFTSSTKAASVVNDTAVQESVFEVKSTLVNENPGKNIPAPLSSRSVHEILISTPMGTLPGKVVLNIDGTNLSGVFSLFKNDNVFSGGTMKDGKGTFSGDLKTPVGKLSYSVVGTFVDGKIEGVAKTKLGDLKIQSKE
jgi:predicted TIM-barrel fold metal-dependent hydrolase